MSTSLRFRVLDAIRDNQPVMNPADLQLVVGANPHQIVHALHSLQKAGLIRYQLRRTVPRAQGSGRSIDKGVPTNIRLR